MLPLIRGSSGKVGGRLLLATSGPVALSRPVLPVGAIHGLLPPGYGSVMPDGLDKQLLNRPYENPMDASVLPMAKRRTFLDGETNFFIHPALRELRNSRVPVMQQLHSATSAEGPFRETGEETISAADGAIDSGRAAVKQSHAAD
jgi:hypothetical protein